MFALLGAIASGLSAGATAVIVVTLRRRWEMRVSSVRWLFFMLYLYLCGWMTLRCAFFVTAVPRSGLAVDPLVITLLLLGNVLLLGVVLWLTLLVFELSRLAMRSMDRGSHLERRQSVAYKTVVHLVLLLYMTGSGVHAVVARGYTFTVNYWLLAVYIVHFASLLFTMIALVVLKWRGRKYEAMHGTWVPSPVYIRLRLILIVYVIFSFPFQLTAIIVQVGDYTHPWIVTLVGVSMVSYNTIGIALSVITGCSQACVLETCRPCIPEDMEAQLLHRRFHSETVVQPVEAPLDAPVFVFTDIEASSALWALDEDGAMAKATDIHDDILRTSLLQHRGYEITTCGDSFQLVFLTIKDAVSYCMDVQLQLLTARWPKELHDVLPATKRQRYGHRLVFNGLRVRMGIHDAHARDGALVCMRHAMTGKMTYTGVAESVASEVGNVGLGGQIVITGRIADWLEAHAKEVDVDFGVNWLGMLHLPQLESQVELYEVLPTALSGRRRVWRQELHAESRATPASCVPSRPSTIEKEQLRSPAIAASTETTTSQLSFIQWSPPSSAS
ncbi:hypothetical protein P43SY_004141 [Pythium insidiosum]|uniref:Guanylate cyclase domain-containing protein n=1 Tax=Pythium insidiosum TaxID=114742 RepID=A0AAD5LX19_PYTIN|nr:hypothetical protein P43SY_004141 [Pythium insidiosum]